MRNLIEDEERVFVGESPEKVLAEHRARYAFAARYARDRRVLDVACGSGYGTRIFHEAGAAAVVGIDSDAGAVDHARRNYGCQEITFLQADACAPPSMPPFDLIASFETIEHLDNPVRFLQGCRALLVPGGMFIVSTPYRHRVHADGTPLNRFHKQEWQTAEFDGLLRRFFTDVALYGQVLKLEKRRYLPLTRWWATPLARLQGRHPGSPQDIYQLPGPGFLGLWRAFPAYLIAVCQRPIAPP